jgi:hypothetical protein
MKTAECGSASIKVEVNIRNVTYSFYTCSPSCYSVYYDAMAAPDVACSYPQFIAIEGLFEVSSSSQHLLKLNPIDAVRHESI